MDIDSCVLIGFDVLSGKTVWQFAGKENGMTYCGRKRRRNDSKNWFVVSICMCQNKLNGKCGLDQMKNTREILFLAIVFAIQFQFNAILSIMSSSQNDIRTHYNRTKDTKEKKKSQPNENISKAFDFYHFHFTAESFFGNDTSLLTTQVNCNWKSNAQE